MENATISLYDRSAPSSVMSVPCSVVMTRGDDARNLAAVRGAENLPRQVSGGRVRHRVVRVDDVEPLVARHLDDLVRERQQVLRLAEQRVVGRLDAMERQARLVVGQAERRLAAEHVDVMPAQRQVLPEFGGDDAAAANRGVTDDSDVHGVLKSDARAGVSRTTTPSAQVTPASAPNCASRLSMSWRNNGVFRRVAAVFGPGA